MVYIDTSALVPIFIREPKTEAVLSWLESAGERVAISEWSLVEFASAAATKVRTREITATFSKQVAQRLQEFADESCIVVMPGRDEFRRASELVLDSNLKLRAGDALHLAIAESLGVQRFLSLDDALNDSARLLRIPVVAP
jgi:predicted nucleic acid-binding protein